MAALALIAAVFARTGGMFATLDLEGVDSALAMRLLYLFIDAPDRLNIVWQPLYTLQLWGISFATDDPRAILLWARFINIAGCALLLYCVGRGMLPAFWAFLLPVWWLWLPEGIAPLYGKHIFYFLALLAGAWMALRADRLAWRLGLIAYLFFCALLLRNEMIVMAALLGVAFFWQDARKAGWGALRAYAPLALGAALFAVLVAAYGIASHGGWTSLRVAMSEKHSLNMCQVYAVSLFQQEPDQGAGKNPWARADCEAVMARDFGEAGLTLGQLVAENPAAVFRMAAWHAGLIPQATAALLFGRYEDGRTPDFFDHRPFMKADGWITYALVAWALFVSLGLVAGVKNATLRDLWVKKKHFWMYCAAGLLMMLVIALTQRPRPIYLQFFGLLLMLVSLMAARGLLAWAWPKVSLWTEGRLAFLAAMIVAPLTMVDHYWTHRDLYSGGHKPRYEQYRLIAAHIETLSARRPQVWITPSPHPAEAFAYHPAFAEDIAKQRNYPIGRLAPGQDLQIASDRLREWGVTMVYIDDRIMARVGARDWAAALARALEARGWRRIEGPAQNRMFIAPEKSP